MMWVIDASVAVKWLLADEGHPHADRVLGTLLDRPEAFAVPELFAFEVFSVIHRLHPNGAEAFSQVMIPILQCGLLRQPMTEELSRAATPFVRSGLTGYDASYAALAKVLEGRWLTYDRKAHRLIQRFNLSCLLEEGLPSDW